MKKIFTLMLLCIITQSILADDVSFNVTVPKDAEFFLGIKPKNDKNAIMHYVAFTEISPTTSVTQGDNKILTYTLTSGTQYNYRTWKSNGLTQAGLFYANVDAAQMPTLTFTADSYTAKSSKTVETDDDKMGDIFVNINERGHLKMKTGDTFDATALRNWEATNSQTANYFIEPAFHYSVTDINGNADNSVISLDKYDTTTSPWVAITAKKKGTAIVTVTYDAMELFQYNSGSATASDFFKGSFFGASRPENTAVYVVTVDDADNAIVPNMTINTQVTNTNKNAGVNVDAELDVFYYLKDKAGYNYTFTPSGAANVEMAYPTIGDNAATYSGFGTTGVTKNADGSYTLLLKKGRQIVRLTDAAGNAVYQVLTAKPVELTVTNATDATAKTFKPGDKVNVKFSTVYHPVNKLAGVYNDAATIYYNNGAVKSKANQYAFASTETAQTISFTIPADYNEGVYSLSNGNIYISGWGDYLGNHRGILKDTGRNPNLNAGMVKAYFGALPDINIVLANITFEDVALAEDATYYNGADEAGLISTATDYSFMNYFANYGTYTSWCGFALSATTGNTFSGAYTDETQFNSCTGGGMESRQFAVGYYSEYNAWFEDQYPEIYATKNFRPEYVYITNTANAVKSMLNGDQYAKKFTADDYLLLTITGLDADDEETGHVDFYLAKDGNIVTEWTKVDLTPLGVVDHVRFTMSSSDVSYGFMNTPAYFCLDNMKAQLTDEETTPAVFSELNSAGYGTFSAATDMAILTPGVKVYKAAVSGNDIVLTQLDGFIPAGTGVLLYGEGMANEEVEFVAPTATATSADISGNSLLPTTIATADIVAKPANVTVWALDDANNFLKYTGSSFAANRAYIVRDVENGAKSMRITFVDNETTAISEIVNAKLSNGTSYNLSGQRVTSSAKGIIIRDGKKYINK